MKQEKKDAEVDLRVVVQRAFLLYHFKDYDNFLEICSPLLSDPSLLPDPDARRIRASTVNQVLQKKKKKAPREGIEEHEEEEEDPENSVIFFQKPARARPKESSPLGA